MAAAPQAAWGSGAAAPLRRLPARLRRAGRIGRGCSELRCPVRQSEAEGKAAPAVGCGATASPLPRAERIRGWTSHEACSTHPQLSRPHRARTARLRGPPLSELLCQRSIAASDAPPVVFSTVSSLSRADASFEDQGRSQSATTWSGPLGSQLRVRCSSGGEGAAPAATARGGRAQAGRWCPARLPLHRAPLHRAPLRTEWQPYNRPTAAAPAGAAARDGGAAALPYRCWRCFRRSPRGPVAEQAGRSKGRTVPADAQYLSRQTRQSTGVSSRTSAAVSLASAATSRAARAQSEAAL